MTQSVQAPMICLLLMLLAVQVFGACDVNTTIISVQENVPVGTVFMRLPRDSGEQWSFREDGQQGYIELNATENSVIFYFAKTPDLEQLSTGKSSVHVALPFTLECSFDGWKHVFKQSIVLMDINDNDPVFHSDRAATITVNENTSPGMPVLQLEDYATDPDVSGYVTAYDVTPHEDLEKDGSAFFAVSANGKELVIQQPLDYDQMKRDGGTFFLLNITAMDNGYPEPRLAHATLQVNVSDSDDQGPAFVYADCPVIEGFCATPLYETVAQKSFTGELRVWPGPVMALDRDSINNTILFYIVKVLPETYRDNFMMDSVTGQIQMIKSFESENIDAIHVTLKAEENSVNRRFLTTTLRVQVVGDYYANYKDSFRNVPINEVVMADDGLLRSLTSSSSFFYDRRSSGDRRSASSSSNSSSSSSNSVPVSLFIATVAVFFVIIVGFPFVMIRVIKGKLLASAGTNPSSSSGVMSLELSSAARARPGLNSQDGGAGRKESSDSTSTSVLTCVSTDACTTPLYGPSRLYNDSDTTSTSSAESTSTSSSTSSPASSRMLPSSYSSRGKSSVRGCYDDSDDICSVSFPTNPVNGDLGNRVSSVSFDPDEVSSRFGICHPFPPVPTRQDVSAAERLKRRFSRLLEVFHKKANNKKDTRQKARVRFDIRNLSNFS